MPAEVRAGRDFIEVGDLTRVEAPEIVEGYSFDLTTNKLNPTKVKNRNAGREHRFRAWRLRGDPDTDVSMRTVDPNSVKIDDDNDEGET